MATEEWKTWARAIAGAPVVIFLMILWFLTFGHVGLVGRFQRYLDSKEA